VVSVEIGDADRALVTLVPHTTSTRGTRYEAVVPVSFLKAGAFDAQGVVTVPPSLALRQLGRLTADQMNAVESALRVWLDLPPDPRR